MNISKPLVQRKILLALDRRPYHGYDLIQLLSADFGKIRQATVYRWLRDMEAEGLVTSHMEAGPYGPDRRVYQVGSRGEKFLRDSLKQSIATILHFYDDYRHTLSGNLQKYLEEVPPMSEQGRVLFIAFPNLAEREIEVVRFLSIRRDGLPIDILGDPTILEKAGIKIREIKGDSTSIAVRDEMFSEVWTIGIPDRSDFPRAISEFKRVLSQEGKLRMLAPFAYFNQPERPSIGEFIRTTAVHLFPDLGIVEGNDVGRIIESYFPICGASEAFPGLVLFWAHKTNETAQDKT